MMEIERQLKLLFDAIAVEARDNPDFAARIRAALDTDEPTVRARRGGRRKPGPLDPFAVYGEHSEEGLRNALRGLTNEQLKDIVAEHGMDQRRLAMKWKSADRLIDLIVDRVRDRAAKGDAFRGPSKRTE